MRLTRATGENGCLVLLAASPLVAGPQPHSLSRLAWDGMRLTEFWERMETRFGAVYADSVARDQVISKLGDRTVQQALADGESAKDVWRAVCEHFEIPVPDRH